MKFTRRCAGGIKIKQKLNAHFVILSGPCLWQSSSRRSNPHEKDLDQDVDHHRPNWKQSELSSLMCTVVTQCDTWSTCSEYCWQVLETISKVVINRSCWQCKPSHPLSKRLVFRIYIYINHREKTLKEGIQHHFLWPCLQTFIQNSQRKSA